jgi:hypothetical protein
MNLKFYGMQPGRLLGGRNRPEVQGEPIPTVLIPATPDKTRNKYYDQSQIGLG